MLGLRPEDFRLTTERESNSVIRGSVELTEPTGPVTFVHLAAGPDRFIVRFEPNCRLQVGEEVFVQAEMANAHWFHAETGHRIA